MKPSSISTNRPSSAAPPPSFMGAAPVEDIVRSAQRLRGEIPGDVHEHLVEAIFGEAARIADRAVTRPGEKTRPTLDRTIDRIVTSRLWGFPIMMLLFAVMFWLTITGANYPSDLISAVLVDRGTPFLRELTAHLGFPWWLRGLLVDGCYLATAWVVSVMLPPISGPETMPGRRMTTVFLL